MLAALVLLGEQLTDANCFFNPGSKRGFQFVVEAIDFIGSRESRRSLGRRIRSERLCGDARLGFFSLPWRRAV